MGEENFSTDEVKWIKKFLNCVSCFCELEQIHGMGEVHTDIRSKTANREEHFRVRGHICQKFF